MLAKGLSSNQRCHPKISRSLTCPGTSASRIRPVGQYRNHMYAMNLPTTAIKSSTPTGALGRLISASADLPNSCTEANGSSAQWLEKRDEA